MQPTYAVQLFTVPCQTVCQCSQSILCLPGPLGLVSLCGHIGWAYILQAEEI